MTAAACSPFSSRTGTDREGQQRVRYDPFAKPSADGRNLRDAVIGGLWRERPLSAQLRRPRLRSATSAIRRFATFNPSRRMSVMGRYDPFGKPSANDPFFAHCRRRSLRCLRRLKSPQLRRTAWVCGTPQSPPNDPTPVVEKTYVGPSCALGPPMSVFTRTPRTIGADRVGRFAYPGCPTGYWHPTAQGTMLAIVCTTRPRRAFALRLSSGAAIASPPAEHFTPVMIDEPKSNRSRRPRSVRRFTYGIRDVRAERRLRQPSQIPRVSRAGSFRQASRIPSFRRGRRFV